MKHSLIAEFINMKIYAFNIFYTLHAMDMQIIYYIFHSIGEPWLFPLSVGWSEPFGCLMLMELKVDSRHHDLTKPSVTTRHSTHISELSFGCLTQLIIVCIYATVCLRPVIIQAQLPRYTSDVQMAPTQMFPVLLMQTDCHTPCVKLRGACFLLFLKGKGDI